MEKLVKVADAIYDAKEFLTENTKDADAVKMYAENGMGIELTDREAARVRAALLSYIEHSGEGLSLNWYTYIEKPLSLSDAEAIIAEVDATGFATIAPGVFLESAASMIAQAATWDDEDPGKAVDFAAFPYWLTTDSGTMPQGVTGADDPALLDVITLDD